MIGIDSIKVVEHAITSSWSAQRLYVTSPSMGFLGSVLVLSCLWDSYFHFY